MLTIIMMCFYQCQDCDHWHVKDYQGECDEQFFTFEQLIDGLIVE